MKTSLLKKLTLPIAIIVVISCISVLILSKRNVDSFIQESSQAELNSIFLIQENLLKKSLNSTYEMLFLLSKNPIFIKSLEDSYVGDIAKKSAKLEFKKILDLHPEYLSLEIAKGNKLITNDTTIEENYFIKVNERIETTNIISKNKIDSLYIRTKIQHLGDENSYLRLSLNIKEYLKHSLKPLLAISNFSYQILSLENKELAASERTLETQYFSKVKSTHLNIIYKNRITNASAIEIGTTLFNSTGFIISVTLICLLLCLYLVMRYYVLEPMKLISQSAKKFEQTNEITLEQIETSKEFSSLTTELIQMKRTIVEKIVEINSINSRLEDTVKERTNKLETSLKNEKEASRAKEVFLANMSHELRTPLNAIIGFSELLSQEEIEGKSHDYIDSISESGQFLQVLINDILNISKIQSGKMTIDNKEFDLRLCFKNISTMLLNKNQNINEILSIRYNSNFDGQIFSDENKLKQVLINLITNSLKFSKEDIPPKIEINVSSAKDSPDRVYFSLKDNGIGIREKDKDSLFEEFQQADNSIKKAYQGVGLGLSICKKIVNSLGGEINFLDSTSGALVEFYITQTKVVSKNADIIEMESPTIFLEEAKILLVEDNQINIKLLSRILEKRNLTKITVGRDGLEGLELAKKEHFDIIFMDLQMPRMDGLTSAKKIIEYYNKEIDQVRPVIIALTANAFEEDEKRCFEVGMNYYLRKPIDMKKLDVTLQEIQRLKKVA